MHNRMGITPRRLWAAICDYDMWPVRIKAPNISEANYADSFDLKIYLIGPIVYIPQNPPGAYLTLSLRQLGFNTVSSNTKISLPSHMNRPQLTSHRRSAPYQPPRHPQ